MKYLLIFLLAATASAQGYLFPTNPIPGVTVSLYNSPSTNVITNYNIYYGVGSVQYTNKTLIGTNLVCRITNLVRGVTYYFNATATDNQGYESSFDGEKSITINSLPEPPTLKPIAILTVQMKNDQQEGWCDTDFTMPIAADKTIAEFRLKIDLLK